MKPFVVWDWTVGESCLREAIRICLSLRLGFVPPSISPQRGLLTTATWSSAHWQTLFQYSQEMKKNIALYHIKALE
jgi:hypothetical protein